MAKKRNATDLTSRNLRAERKRNTAIGQAIRKLAAAVTALNLRVAVLERKGK